MIQKFLKFQKLPKAGPIRLRREISSDPRTNLMFLELLKLAQAKYPEVITDSVGAVYTRLPTRDRSVPNQPLAWRGGKSK